MMRKANSMAFTTLILAAGAGTRMNSSVPKAAHTLLGKPLIRWVIDAAYASKSDYVITVVGHEREQVLSLVADTTVVFQEELKGTGHAVMMARAQLETLAEKDPSHTLLVLCGDTSLLTVSTINSLVASHEDQHAAASVVTFITDDPTGYGRIIRNAQGLIESIIEEKDATANERAITEVNSGMYCFDLNTLLASLDSLDTNNAQGEYYLTDVIATIRQTGGVVQAYLCDDKDEMLGVNDRVQLAQATAVAQQRINRVHMLAGVTMLDPASVWIEPDVTLGTDVEILPLTLLKGTTTIGSGCTIGPNTRIVDSTVGSNCVIEESILVGATLEDTVRIGPRAYLRPGTIMRTGSRAGTHVEIKKSDIGANSKVPHLSYLGDTTLGQNVNIGAGAITCNYDGVSKHPTTIGDRSFIGSDTMFVAPVTIGCDVVTGAGSVITRDVPDGALAIERNEQRILENWTQRKRSREAEHEKTIEPAQAEDGLDTTIE